MKNITLLSVVVMALTLFSCKKKEENKEADKKGAAATKSGKNDMATKPVKPAKPGEAAKVTPKTPVGPTKLPDFKIPSMWGGECTPKDYLGKPSIVEVWAMSCPHCRHQAKYLEELAEKLDFTKYAIVSIHARGGDKLKDKIGEHFKNKKIQVCLDSGAFIKSLRALPKEYQVRGIPHLFMVNAKGEITEVLRGARKADLLKTKLEAMK
ncbi:TlpA family protein disulfide reductase [Myxococcota bacterium]|nr:TlpA family protein disulfide reductase [Myxococcota bacterium]MBU1535327.1 TlpA family protein disulfide reductase [Myxococcota bacterium]